MVIVSTVGIVPLVWLKLTTSFPRNANGSYGRGLYNLNLSNFETFELRDGLLGRRLVTLCNNAIHSKLVKHTDVYPPAVVWYNGSLGWWTSDQRHRGSIDGIDQPMWVGYDCNQLWYVNGEQCRDSVDGISQPTNMGSYGTREWLVNGQRHRIPINGVDQPAYVNDYGGQSWYTNNRLHRNSIDGVHQPVWVAATGCQQWYIDGQLRCDLDGLVT